MNFTYDSSVTPQVKTWIGDALNRWRYPHSTLNLDVRFEVVAEPPAPGHRDYMSATDWSPEADAYVISIRDGADDPTADFNQWLPDPAADLRAFFLESVAHELAHVLGYWFVATDEVRTTVASYFQRTATGEGMARGELADWNPLGQPWEDRIQEAMAEALKDTWLADAHRVYDNRTNWWISAADHALLIPLFQPPDTAPVTEWAVIDDEYPMVVTELPPEALLKPEDITPWRPHVEEPKDPMRLRHWDEAHYTGAASDMASTVEPLVGSNPTYQHFAAVVDEDWSRPGFLDTNGASLVMSYKGRVTGISPRDMQWENNLSFRSWPSVPVGSFHYLSADADFSSMALTPSGSPTPGASTLVHAARFYPPVEVEEGADWMDESAFTSPTDGRWESGWMDLLQFIDQDFVGPLCVRWTFVNADLFLAATPSGVTEPRRLAHPTYSELAPWLRYQYTGMVTKPGKPPVVPDEYPYGPPTLGAGSGGAGFMRLG